MGRREFIALLGSGVAGWPLAARAQQAAMPVIGFLNVASPDGYADLLRAFHQGLKDTGYVEGENVAIVYRWAEGQYPRLPELAAELVRRQVAVIAATGGIPSPLAAKAATTTVPIVFVTGGDPVRDGLVASLNRPGGNMTGINFLAGELAAKRLELLRELVPAAARVAVLVDPANAEITGPTLRDVEAAARAMGLQIQVLNANTSREIDAAFATVVRERPDALFVGPGPVFVDRRVQVALLAARSGVPAIYVVREQAVAGGLMSYGASVADAYRQVGVYTGRILKGAKPADLPVVRSSKFELVINHQTARMLGLEIPPTLIARADEVIE
ncbi:MAG TPA: ABC transporter substrate-binding protein [Xanthobacteraceae bacterium]|nr:ABC transporter substrate-binding protein [Xanthobacteraceae bacterium]